MPRRDANRLTSLRQRAIACAGIGTYRYTYDGVVERMDPLAFAIFGLDEHFAGPKEVVGRNLTDLFEYLHPVGEGRKQVERFGRVHGLERQFNTLLGQRKWVLADLWHIDGEDGGPPLIEAVVRDITRLKMAEEQLRESDERWQLIFNQPAVPKLILDAKSGVIMDANDAAESFYGWSRSTLRDSTAASIVEGMAEGATPADWDAPFLMQRHLRAQGAHCPVVVHSTPYTWRGRDCLLWVIHDISTAGIEGVELAARGDRYRRIAEADADYLYRVRIENGAAVETDHELGCLAVTGYSSEAFREDPYLWLSMVWDEDQEAVLRQAEAALAAESFEALEHRIVRKDGAIRWVRNTPVPEFDANGRLVAYDGLIRDITARREAEELVREREEQFRTVFETGYQAMFVLSADLRIIECNSAALALHGMTREELIAAPVERRMPPRAMDQMLRAFDIAAREGRWAGDSERYGPQGEVLQVEAAVTRHFVHGQMHFLVSVNDISERKRLEAELAAVKDTLDQTLDAVVMVDSETVRFIYANRGAVELFGLNRAQLENRTPLDLLPDYTLQELREVLRPLRRGEVDATTLTTRILHADGHLVPVDLFIQFVDPPGSPARYIGLLRDISERLRAEAALRESEAALTRAQRIAHLGSWSHTVGTDAIQLSGEARGIVGQPQDTAAFPFPDFVKSLCHPPDWPELRDAFDACIEHGVGFEREVSMVHATGSIRRLAWTGAGVVDNAGKVREIHGTVQDITERKRAEEERLKLESKMRHAQKLESLGVLAGGIAHDFNNILTAILGNAGLLLEDLPEEGPHRKRLNDIEAAARRAAELSQQMLAYSGRGNFIIRLIDMNNVVRETSVILTASIPTTINLHFDFAADLPPVQGDAAQLSQLVMNIVTNAFEAIEDAHGEVSVRTSLLELPDDHEEQAVDDEPIEPGAYVCLDVTDSGCGMPADVRSRLFDPFFTTKFTGRGLGLAAVLGVVRAHHGAIQLSSTLGQGTHFRVLLPAAAGQAARPIDSVPSVDGFRGEGAVLLVDDEPAIRIVGKRMLERLGFTVLVAEDGKQGVALFEKHKDDIVCVVLDLIMPRMDGAEAMQEMFRMRPGVKIILCSGYSRAELTARFADQGLAGFLHKPFQMRQLAGAMQAALNPGGTATQR